MTVLLNGEPVEITTTSLAEALDELGYRGMTIATAVNGDFVHRDARAATVLRAGDRLEVVAPLQGG